MTGDDRRALGIASPDGSILVCLNPVIPLRGLEELVHLLPMLGRIFREEHQRLAECGQAVAMKGATADAQRWAESLDRARRELEVALRGAEEMRKQILSVVRYAPDPMFCVAPDGILLQVNDMAQHLLGLEAGAPLHTCLQKRLLPEEVEQFLQAITVASREGTASDVRVLSRTPSGLSVPTSLNAAALYDSQHRVLGVIGTLRDMSRYEEIVSALRRSQSELQEKIRDLELFHDVVVGRELRMAELEKELKAVKQGLLAQKAEKPPPAA